MAGGAFALVVVIIAGLILFTGENEKSVKSEGQRVERFVSGPAGEQPVREGEPVAEPVVVEVLDYCEIAADVLKLDGDCDFVEFHYNTGKAAALKIGEAYAVVTGKEEAKKLTHANFYNYKSILVKHAKASGLKISDKDFESANVQLRSARGDYLISATFAGDVNGRVYVTPEGLVRGRLN